MGKAINKYKQERQKINHLDKLTLKTEEGVNLDGSDAFSKIMSLKADQKDLESLNNLKFNKDEAQNMQDIIMTLNL